MTKLVSTYAGATGLLIDHPNIKEAFFPHPFERYITIQTGAGQNAKCYDLFQELVATLKPILDANQIAILHLGAKEDPPLNGVHDLRGKTTFLQSHYLIKRTLCHVGNDSWLAHAAGWNYRPLVALYGSTDPGPHGPYWYDVAKTTLITSHRNGGRPTFVQQENPKTINLIPPEQVANAVLCLLGITDLFTHSTLYVGPVYQHMILELIPNLVPAPTFCPELPITVRMDCLFDENTLGALLQTGRKVHIITKRVIALPLLSQFRAQVLSYSHEVTLGVDEPAVGYTDAIRSMFPTAHVFFTRETDEAKVSALRFTYFDHVVINVHKDLTKEDYLAAILVYLNRPDTPENRLDIAGQLGHHVFKTNRYLLSGNAVYLSHAHFAANKPTQALTDNKADVIDDPAFYRDMQHHLVTLRP